MIELFKLEWFGWLAVAFLVVSILKHGFDVMVFILSLYREFVDY